MATLTLQQRLYLKLAACAFAVLSLVFGWFALSNGLAVWRLSHEGATAYGTVVSVTTTTERRRWRWEKRHRPTFRFTPAGGGEVVAPSLSAALRAEAFPVGTVHGVRYVPSDPTLVEPVVGDQLLTDVLQSAGVSAFAMVLLLLILRGLQGAEGRVPDAGG